MPEAEGTTPRPLGGEAVVPFRNHFCLLEAVFAFGNSCCPFEYSILVIWKPFLIFLAFRKPPWLWKPFWPLEAIFGFLETFLLFGKHSGDRFSFSKALEAILALRELF